MMDDKIGILVVDDHSLFRRGVIQTINEQSDMEVVAEADSVASAVLKAGETLPDIALLDVKLPDGTGLDIAEQIQRDCPFTRIILLTVVEDEDVVVRALKGGAHGYVLKGVSANELVSVVRSVHRGETYVSPSVAGRLLSELTSGSDADGAKSLVGGLSERERSILELVAQGKTNKEIADELFLSEKTVKHYMTNVLHKLHVRNRVEAALLLRDGGA
jgi:DNA-binding NarL/FixJ family response regulator